MVSLYFWWPHPGREPPVGTGATQLQALCGIRRSTGLEREGPQAEAGGLGEPWPQEAVGLREPRAFPFTHTHPVASFLAWQGYPAVLWPRLPVPHSRPRPRGLQGLSAGVGRVQGLGRAWTHSRQICAAQTLSPRAKWGMAGVWQHGKRPYRPSPAASWCLQTRVLPEQLPVCQDPGIVLLEPPYSHVRSLIIPILLM